jgi:hypothetical protein
MYYVSTSCNATFQNHGLQDAAECKPWIIYKWLAPTYELVSIIIQSRSAKRQCVERIVEQNSMKMVIVLVVCLALSAASVSAMQMPCPCAGLQGLYGAGAGLTTMMGAGGLYPYAEYLRQPQCSPLAAAPYYAGCGQPSAMFQPLRQQCCQQQMRMMDVQSVAQQLQMMMQLERAAAASSSLYEPALMQQQQQLLAAQGLNPMAMMMAQNMPAMGGLYQYQLPSYRTNPCGVSAAIPPYY